MNANRRLTSQFLSWCLGKFPQKKFRPWRFSGIFFGFVTRLNSFNSAVYTPKNVIEILKYKISAYNMSIEILQITSHDEWINPIKNTADFWVENFNV